MDNLCFVSDYKDNNALRASFNRLSGMIFGIDFESWYALGFWSDSYICYSFADSGRIVANVSANRIKASVNNKIYRTVQIGTVMTHPDYRGKGLAKALMDRVLSVYESNADIIYLLPDEDAMAFYNKFGFSRARDCIFCLDGDTKDRSLIPPLPARTLNIEDKKDCSIIQRLCRDKIISPVFDISDSFHILSWYLCGLFKRDALYIKSLDAMVIHRPMGNALKLYSVISPKKQNLSDILDYIDCRNICIVELCFTPDLLDYSLADFRHRPNDIILYKGKGFSFPEPFAHPVISQA